MNVASVSGPVVIVTGASRGLGAATARWLARFGAGVILTARDSGNLSRLEKSLRDAGATAQSIPADISNPHDCEKIIVETLRHFGRIDALINNAGSIAPLAAIAASRGEDWQANFAVNVFGPVELIRLALPDLRKPHGRIVNVSSGAAVTVNYGMGAYSTAKAALTHLTRILAVEEPDITALAFRPGSVNTSMQQAIREKGENNMPEAARQKFIERFEKGALLAPELPGKAAAVLALRAPHEWSGEFIRWNEQRVQALVEQFETL